MGSFGTAVTSLLETYTKCLSLLRSHRDDTRDGGDDASSDSLQSSLNSSLRSDRARVRRAYSSHLLQNGSRFEKGDVASQSALKQIVKRLTAALDKVVRSFGSREPPVLDYNSLLALSHGTSLDGVRTIEDLSHRVSSGASSGASSSSSRRSAVSKGKKKQGRRHPRQSDGKSKKKLKTGKTQGKSAKVRSKKNRSKSKSSVSSSSARSSNRHRQKASQTQEPKNTTTATENRVSLVTIASDSTKLGEIRRRASRQGLRNASATYPLYMYPPEEGKKRKKWWKVFESD